MAKRALQGEDGETDDGFEVSVDDGTEIEIVDDTPESDRDREPMPASLVEELEADELTDYGDAVKQRLKQLKKVWHDERRAKEREEREKNEAVTLAQRLLEDNKQLRGTLSKGETTLISSFKETSEMELEAARTAYRVAYEAGDTEKVLEAQEKLTDATIRLNNLKNYRPTVQAEETEVFQQQSNVPALDAKTQAWQERNTWWGTDPEMTATALGFHQKLERDKGAAFVGTDEYWKAVDVTMRRRFPEYFTDEQPARQSSGKRPPTVVASASRSTGPRKVVLTKTQAALAKRLGLTLEQYAEAQLKLEH